MNPDPIETLLARLRAAGCDPRPAGTDRWISRCPAHRGSRRNLCIRRGDDGRALVYCHHTDEAGGCTHTDIVSALGLGQADLFPPDPSQPKARARGKPRGRRYPTPEAAIAATSRRLGEATGRWIYHHDEGTEAFRVYRFDPPGGSKEYRPVHPDQAGGWRLGDPPGPLPLFGLPGLADATRVYVPEGEKVAQLARNVGVSATTSAHGAKSAAKTDWSPLAGREVVILPDHDPEGEGYAKAVMAQLARLEPRPRVKIARLADLWRTDEPILEGADLEEWLESGTPDSWDNFRCRAELERQADFAPEEDLGAAESETPPADDVVLTCLSDVDEAEVEWEWDGRIPRGMITLIFGDPDLGKSFMFMDIIARISAGRPLPGEASEPKPPGSVIMLCAEDSPAHTIKPRLSAAGADMSRIHLLEWVKRPDGMLALFNLKTELPKLESALRKVPGTRVIYIDPVPSYYGGASGDKDTDIRGVLGPLKDLAERYNVAVVVVSHMNKKVGNKPQYRVLGSIALIGIVRAAFLVVKDKDDPGRRLFLNDKMNVAPKPGGLAFRIDGETRRVIWEDDPVDTTAEEALAAVEAEPKSKKGHSDLVGKAAAWLRAFLAGGQRASEDCVSQGNEALGAERRMEWWRDHVLKGRLKGGPRKAGFKGPWVWELAPEGHEPEGGQGG